MSQSLKPYLDEVRRELSKALCLSFFPSPVVERHSKPEVEMRTTPEALLKPVSIVRSSTESVLIEPSINSTRVSLKIKQADELEALLCHKFAGFMMQRADSFSVLRRKPVDGYDMSFLITHEHTEATSPAKLVDFIISFMEEVDREISEMKLGVNGRARLVSETFLREFARD